MPLQRGSRYTALPVFDAADADGEAHATIAMRLVDPALQNETHFQHTVTGVQTIEYLAFRFFGSSQAWWRIADANPTTFPLDLVTGEVVNVPSTDDVGRVVRDRRF